MNLDRPQEYNKFRPSRQGILCEETKLSSAMRRGSDNEFNSLLGDYQDAVECLIHCESIINDLQEKLALRDEQIKDLEEANDPSVLRGKLAARDKRIESLEEKIIEMSLELASSKAFEDEHRGKRIASGAGGNISDDECHSPGTAKSELQRKAGLASSTDIHASGASSGISTARRLSWWRGSDNSAMDDGAKTSLGSSTCSVFDDSSLSGLSIDAGRLLLRRSCIGNQKELRLGEAAEEKQGKKERQASGDGDHPPRRRPSRRRTQLHSECSSSFLEESGVVFPKSFEEVLSKGCGDLRHSLKGLKEKNRHELLSIDWADDVMADCTT